MKYLTLLLTTIILSSCGNDPASTPEKKLTPIEKKANENDLIKLEGDLYTEFYPGGKAIKFQGRLDENGKRMGLWIGYMKNGKELSQSEYIHGELHGITVVKRENGTIYYSGEFDNGKKVGEWIYRNEDGSVNYVRNYDED